MGLDFYLGNTPTVEIRANIEDLIQEAVTSTPAGVLKMKVLKVLSDN